MIKETKHTYIKHIAIAFFIMLALPLFANTKEDNMIEKNKATFNWSKVLKEDATVVYVDFDKIEKRDGYIYYFALFDYNRVVKAYKGYDYSSIVSYYKLDCKEMRDKELEYQEYTKAMGKGDVVNYIKGQSGFRLLPSIKSGEGIILLADAVCKHVAKS